MTVIIHKLYGIEPTLEAKPARWHQRQRRPVQACRTPREVAELARTAGTEVTFLTRLFTGRTWHHPRHR